MLSRGEYKLKQLLDCLLPDENYIDNFRPDWLCNPSTGANLELDRYYPKLKIGIEFNGPQHRKQYNPYQWHKDHIKKHLCAKQQVIRLVFYANELTLPQIYQKLQDVQQMRKAWANGQTWVKGSLYDI